MDDLAYVVDIKPSARKRCAAVGEWVAEHGGRREFGSKRSARRWAERQSEPGSRVWVQDANPNDPAAVDGYLVGGERSGGGEEDEPYWWEPEGQAPLASFDEP